jgi:hypothetical protein
MPATLPTNVQTIKELKQLFTYYAENHKSIFGIVFGKFVELEEYMKKRTKGQIVMYVPYPSMRPRDQKGSIDFRYFMNVHIFQVTKQGLRTEELDNVDQAGTIMMELLIRLRQDASDKGWTMTINDINEMDPLIDYAFNGVAGWQAGIYIGDHFSPVPKTTRWVDLDVED